MVFEERITTLPSFCAILLREARVERRLHQAQIADALGQTASAWTKVETGKSPLQLDTLMRVSNWLNTQASTVIGVAERYSFIFQQNGWVVLPCQANSIERDDFLNMAQKYWSSPGGKSFIPGLFNSILNGPNSSLDGTIMMHPIFQYALDSSFRDYQDHYVPMSLNLSPLS